MRTKHLLTAMVLPALFAACTNDDFEGLSQNAPSIEGRAMVDNVTLNVNPVVGTRLAWDGAYRWEAGDEIGACLMDVVNTTNYGDETKLWHERFTLVDYIQTNYKFTRGEGETADWTTEAKMCEGNYFFVYPYNANKGSRDAYSFELDAQVLEGTDNASLMKAYTDNNAFVGFGKVVAGDTEGESVAVNMIPVFGGTGIVIENHSGLPFTVEKIVVKGTKVAKKVTIDPTACTQATQYIGVTPTTGDEQKFNVAQYTQDPAESILANPSGYYNPAATTYDAEAALADALTVDAATDQQVEVTFKGGNTVQNDNSINIIVMLAAADVTTGNGEVNIDIYTDKGIVQDVKLNEEDTNSSDDDITVIGALTALGKGGKVKVTLDANAFKTPSELPVGSAADLINLIEWRAEAGTPITANLAANLTLTKEVYDALKASEISQVTINGDNQYSVTIDAAATDGTLDAFTYKDVTKVTVNGTQSMTVAPAAPVEVAAGATLNITKAVALTNTITNKGTLNVKANVTAKSGVQKINNEGTMTVAAGIGIKSTTASTVEAQVVNGTATAAATLTNAGTIDVLTNVAKSSVTNTGVIGTTGTTLRGNNAGTITNNGEINMLKNSGTIYANGQSNTTVTDNAENTTNGTIVITNLDESRGNVLVTGTQGYKAQEIKAESSIKDIDSRANAVWLSAKLNIDVTDKDGEYSDQTANVTIFATGANAEIYGHSQQLTVNGLAVNAGATLYLTLVDVKLAASGTVTMNGVPGNPATLQVNSNGSLVDNSGAPVTVSNADGVTNIYKNFAN